MSSSHLFKHLNPCLLGAHLSIAKGLHHALYSAATYHCNALQIFTKNAQTWKERQLSSEEIERFKQAKAETGIEAIASHTSYLINLAAPDPKKHTLSCKALKQELIRSSKLELPYVVLHPGSHMGKSPGEGVHRIAESINAVFAETPEATPRLLLETTAGQGTGIGHTFEQLAAIMEEIDEKERIGICLDTCHIFAAGYDIRNRSSCRKTMSVFDSIIGLSQLYLIHLNDSQKGLGSRVDRHEHIGEGMIGIQAFGYFMNAPELHQIPKIIETPKTKNGRDADAINLNKLRSLQKKAPTV